MQDTFKRIIKKLLGIQPPPQNQKLPRDYWGEQRYLERTEFKYVLWLDRVYQKMHHVPGHIVELGVAYGRNAVLFSHLVEMHNESDLRKYIGFDTFDGYNEDSLKNEQRLSSDAWKDISIEAVKGRVAAAKSRTKTSFVKGDILETVPRYVTANPDLRIALLYVDCNAYKPAIESLRVLKEFMTPGGIVCIDEKLQGGETRALIEFCEENGLEFKKDTSPFSIPAYTVVK